MPIVLDRPAVPGSGVQLRRLFLNDAVDLADLCSFQYAGEKIGASTAVAAEVRQLAGRRRVVRREGARAYTAFEVTLPWCDAEQARWLVAHVGRVVCFRDHAGSKVYGVYFEVPAELHSWYDPGGSWVQRNVFADAKVSVQEIDHSEAVA